MAEYTYRYPHPAVTTDCIVFGYDGLRLNVLLIERGGDPYKGAWAFPGGFLNIDEDAPDGARRELLEETGLRVTNIEQLGAFAAPDRDPRERVISIAYFTLTRVQDVTGGDDARVARWFPINQLTTSRCSPWRCSACPTTSNSRRATSSAPTSLTRRST